MEWLFGKKMSPDEMLRKNQRALNKAMRDLDREKMKMEQQEKKIIADIKKLAKEGQMDAVKIMAKDLVRTRRYTKKFMLMKANIQAVSLKIQTLKSQNTMAEAMKGEYPKTLSSSILLYFDRQTSPNGTGSPEYLPTNRRILSPCFSSRLNPSV